MIDSYQRIEIRKQKQRVIDNSILADQIVRGIGAMFSEKEDEVEIKQVWDYYPNLFDREKEVFEKQKDLEELEKFKEKRRKFALQHNKMMGDDERGQ